MRKGLAPAEALAGRFTLLQRDNASNVTTSYGARAHEIEGYFPEVLWTAARQKSLASSVHLPSNLAGLSIRGRVARENQDRALVFGIKDWCFMILADGVGGERFGAEAAQAALEGAVREILRLMGGPAKWRCIDPATLAALALDAAQSAVYKAAASIPLNDFQPGFRTTLIIIAATPTTYGYAYCGDGGAYLRRQDGRVESLLDPQRLSMELPLLTSSLGPVLEGQPAIGTIQREPGDLLLAGTDGVFDDRRAMPNFIHEFNSLLAECGALQMAVKRALRELADYRDGIGDLVFDDNLSLAALSTTGQPTSLAREVLNQNPEDIA